jgi:hypothetical protein
MKLCQSCWDKLKDAIESRGMMALVAKNGEIACKQVSAQIHGDTSTHNYDPLMSANFAIWNQALSSFGLSMMAEDAPCPLCLKTEIEANCTEPDCGKQTGDMWIEFAAEEQLAYCRNRGLVARPS